jgi:hypothetical protein
MATQLEKEMRRFVLVLAFAALAAPSILAAQQPRERDPASDIAPSADLTANGARNANAPRSLMGMVMSVLIDSAEQQAATKRDLVKQDSDRITNDRNTTKLQPAQASRPHEQVAVQSEP